MLSQPVVVEQEKKSQALLMKTIESQKWSVEKSFHFNESHWLEPL